MLDVPGWIQFIKEYGYASAVGAVVAIYLASKIYYSWYPRLKEVFKDQETLLQTRESYKDQLKEILHKEVENLEDKCQEIALETSEKYWKGCQIQRCPKMDELSSELHRRLDNEMTALNNALSSLGEFLSQGTIGRIETQTRLEAIYKEMHDTREIITQFVNAISLAFFSDRSGKIKNKGGSSCDDNR